jgi:N-acetylglucosamine-6-phosphate deacetylase
MMDMKAIISGRIITPHGIVDQKILLFDECIHGIVDDLPEGDVEVIDVKGAYVSPGFIDLHVHGMAGSDVMDGSYEALDTISRTQLKSGVTTFLGTTMTMETSVIIHALDAMKEYGEHLSGAKLAGVHLEGPFISSHKKGAQSKTFIQAPNLDWILDYMDLIKIITYAPETDVDYRFTEAMKAYPHVSLSIGHSNATFDCACAAHQKGVKGITHLFNAMTGLLHREPGVVGAALTNDFYTEVIFDNVHVRPELYSLIWRLKGENRLVGVTDCMRAGYLDKGTYDLGGQEVFVDQTSARLKDGTLAGSVLKLNEGLKNIVHSLDIPLESIVKIFTQTPAAYIGLEDRGQIKVGFKADFAVFNDAFDVTMTFVDGSLKHIKT